MTLHVIRGSGVPTLTPPAIGVHYFDTVARTEYISFGTASAADWVLQNSVTASYLVKNTVLDSTAGYLVDKLKVGTGLSATTINPTGNEYTQLVNTDTGTGAVSTHNLAFTHSDIALNTAARHTAVTLGVTSNGLGLSTQELSLQAATGSVPGALTAADWITFNGKQAALSFGTAGSIQFSSGTALSQDTANFFWDDATDTLATKNITSKLTTDVPVLGAEILSANDSGFVSPVTWTGADWSVVSNQFSHITGVESQTTNEVDLADADGYSFSVSGNSGVFIHASGTSFYRIASASSICTQYTLATPYELTGTVSSGLTFNFTTDAPGAKEIHFKSDGTQCFVLSQTNKNIVRFTLGTPWDISTCIVDVGQVLSLAALTAPFGLEFSTDGTKCFVGDTTTNKITRYDLSGAWDLTTASYVSEKTLVVASIYGICVTDDGRFISVNVGGANNVLKHYRMSTPFDITTVVVSLTVFPTPTTAVTQQYTAGLCRSPNGKRLYVCGASRVQQYIVPDVAYYGTTPLVVGTTYRFGIAFTTLTSGKIAIAVGGASYGILDLIGVTTNQTLVFTFLCTEDSGLRIPVYRVSGVPAAIKIDNASLKPITKQSPSIVQTLSTGVVATEITSTSTRNLSIGLDAGKSCYGSDNFTIGNKAFESATSASQNVAMGTNAGRLFSNGDANTFFGYSAGAKMLTGSNNLCIGRNALSGSLGGTDNVAVGADAMVDSKIGGAQNIAIGIYALRKTNGSSNTGIGAYAGAGNTSGSGNVSVGYFAGFSGTTHSYRIHLGNWAGFNNATASTFIVDSTASGRSSAADEEAKSILFGTMDTAPANQWLKINADLTVKNSTIMLAKTAATIPSVSRGTAAQTANLQEWQDSSSSVLASVSATGIGKFAGVGVGTAAPAARLHIANAANEIKEVVQGGTGQTANLTEWQDSTTAILAQIDSLGAAKFSGLKLGIRTVTSSPVLTAADYTVKCDCTTGNQTVTLPSGASEIGRILVFKKIDATANTVTVGTVDGATLVISTQYSPTYMVQYDGTVWSVI